MRMRVMGPQRASLLPFDCPTCWQAYFLFFSYWVWGPSELLLSRNPPPTSPSPPCQACDITPLHCPTAPSAPLHCMPSARPLHRPPGPSPPMSTPPSPQGQTGPEGGRIASTWVCRADQLAVLAAFACFLTACAGRPPSSTATPPVRPLPAWWARDSQPAEAVVVLAVADWMDRLPASLVAASLAPSAHDDVGPSTHRSFPRRQSLQTIAPTVPYKLRAHIRGKGSKSRASIWTCLKRQHIAQQPLSHARSSALSDPGRTATL